MATGILIYEDNENLGNSIRTLFQWNEAYKVLAVQQHPGNILTDIKVHQPDVILMDIDMPVINGVDALRLLRQNRIALPVIMLTIFEDDDNILEAIRAGANGYLLKKNLDRLIPSIREVLDGGAPMSGYVARRVLQLFSAFGNKPGIDQEFDLSPREREILDLLVKGFSYKMTADKLAISLDTIRSHIKKIYKKLEVNSATEAIYKYTHSK